MLTLEYIESASSMYLAYLGLSSKAEYSKESDDILPNRHAVFSSCLIPAYLQASVNRTRTRMIWCRNFKRGQGKECFSHLNSSRLGHLNPSFENFSHYWHNASEPTQLRQLIAGKFFCLVLGCLHTQAVKFAVASQSTSLFASIGYASHSLWCKSGVRPLKSTKLC